MKKQATLIIIALFVSSAVAAQQNQTGIGRFLRVNEEFCTGGQPPLAHLTRLKDIGIKSIINLRPHSEHNGDREEARAKALGFRYFNIPVIYTDPKDEQVAEFLKITDDPENRPAFIHCAAAIRVGGFWMIRRVLRDGWSLEQAEEEARKIGLHSQATHLWEFARNYIEKHKKK